MTCLRGPGTALLANLCLWIWSAAGSILSPGSYDSYADDGADSHEERDSDSDSDAGEARMARGGRGTVSGNDTRQRTAQSRPGNSAGKTGELPRE